MKVIGINASPRKKNNSASMLENALKGAESNGAETNLIHLTDISFSGCISCFACKRLGGKNFGRCAVNDGLKEILESILSADAVIFSMPVYFGDVPGMARNIFERIWFPGLLYKKDGSIAYEKKVKVGLIYTMNVGDETYYDQLISSHRSTFERFLGETHTLCATDTLQFDDYSKYSGDMFDETHKRQRHETVFPVDCEKAFEMGKKLTE